MLRHARMELTMESREGPTTQDGTGHLMAVSRLLFEGTMAHCLPSGISGEDHSTPSVPSDSSGRKYGGVFFKRMCIELAMEAREGSDPEDKAEFHMAATPPLLGLDVHPVFLMRSLANHPTPVGLPTALEEMWCGTSPARTQQCVHFDDEIDFAGSEGFRRTRIRSENP